MRGQDNEIYIFMGVVAVVVLFLILRDRNRRQRWALNFYNFLPIRLVSYVLNRFMRWIDRPGVKNARMTVLLVVGGLFALILVGIVIFSINEEWLPMG